MLSMESFLPLIIMLIIGAIMSGKRGAKSSGESESKPFTAGQQQPGSPMKKFKEVSSEMYKEIQREFQQQDTERQQPEQRQQPVQRQQQTIRQPINIEPKVVVAEKPKRENREVTARRSRHSKYEIKDEIAKNEISLEGLLPKSHNDLVKGVIFSEIFDAPKSKR